METYTRVLILFLSIIKESDSLWWGSGETVTHNGSSVFVLENTEASFQCSIPSVFHCPKDCGHFIWTVNNTRIITNNHYLVTGNYSNELVFHDGVKRNETGNKYQCDFIHHNGTGYASPALTLYVWYWPKVYIEPEFEPLKVKRGSDVNLTCVIEEYILPVTPRLTWNLAGDSSSRRSIDNIQNDTFIQCHLIIPFNSTHDVTLTTNRTIEVQYAPVISPLPDLYVRLGDSVRVKCHVDANPPAHVTWIRTNTSGFLNGPHLSIQRAQIIDDGGYTCSANNTLSLSEGNHQFYQRTKTFTLHVQYGPEIAAIPSDTSPLEGENVTIHCHVRAHQPYDVYLERMADGVIYRSNPVVFYNISRDQSGVYRCIAKNTWHLNTDIREERVANSTFHLGILYGPGGSLEINTPSPPPIKLDPDDDVIVYCYSSCNPPCHVTWQFPDGSLVNGSKLTLSYRMTTGSYSCTAQNGIGKTTEYIEILKMDRFKLNNTSFGIGLAVGIGLLAIMAAIFVVIYCRRKQITDKKAKEDEKGQVGLPSLTKRKDSKANIYMDLRPNSLAANPDYAQMERSNGNEAQTVTSRDNLNCYSNVIEISETYVNFKKTTKRQF